MPGHEDVERLRAVTLAHLLGDLIEAGYIQPSPEAIRRLAQVQSIPALSKALLVLARCMRVAA